MKPDITKVLFLWKPASNLLKYFKRNLSGFSNIRFYFPKDDNSSAYITKHIQSADIVIGWNPKSSDLDIANNLKLLINPGAGVKHLVRIFSESNIDSENISIVNSHGNSYATAQHALAILLTLTNRVIHHHQWLSKGKRRLGDESAKSILLKNKVVGFLGYGHVAKYLHKFLSGFELDFIVLKRSQAKIKGLSYTFTVNELDTFFKKSDIVVSTLPQTDETKNLIKLKQLRLLGKDGLLVNVGRGDSINEQSLYKALKERIIAGAAIDVWYNYKPEKVKGKMYPYSQPFHELDNVVISPHRAASPFDDLGRWDDVIENVKRFCTGKKQYLNIISLNDGY